MKTTFKFLLSFLAIAICGASASALAWADTPVSQPSDQHTDPQMIRKGEYLARAGDCFACHSTPQGKPFAGGLGIASPIGKIYSTNITPDKQYGIGAWSFFEFDRLMRRGITRAGYTVYPAMPYPSFSRISEEDMHALYAYFMHGVTADAAPNKKADIPWPLSMRFPLAIWRWAFAPKPEAMPAAIVNGSRAADAQLLRGAYLVQGLGHCGACHTARGFAFQEKALTDKGNMKYLAGGAILDGWMAPSLRNGHGGGLARWSEADIVTLLKTGRNDHSATFGGMNDVITHSMQYMSEADLYSIAKYLKSLPPESPAPDAFVADDKAAAALREGRVEARGAQIYLDRCAGCHRSDGKGYAKAFPALAGNAILQAEDPSSAIHIVLSGGAIPATRTAPSSLTMAPYATILNDQQIADVVSFIQTNWGNRGGPATASQVAKMRKTAAPVEPLTAKAYAPGRAGTFASGSKADAVGN